MNIHYRCSFAKKITALAVSLCMAAAFVPAVGASPVSDSDAKLSGTVEMAAANAQVQTDTASSPDKNAASSQEELPVSSQQEITASSQEEAAVSSQEEIPASSQEETAVSSQEETAAPTSDHTDDLDDDGSQSSSYTQTSEVQSSNGFQNVETDGGVILVGTARIPKENGSVAVVKFVYSSSLNLNEKSFALINRELGACGVTIPNGMIYVSRSDIVSDSQLMNSTSENQAVFAVGSANAPSVLKPYPAYGSVEESFERLFKGYIFSISGYSSLRSLLEGREEVTVSEDGQTASTSIVMSEDYVEKTINGRKIKILMINSELKYYFRAPKLIFKVDEDYVSDSDIVYHYPTRTTTDPSDTLTTADADNANIITNPFIDDDTTTASTDTTVAVIDTTAPTTTTTTVDPFWDDDGTLPTIPTRPTDDNGSTTTENTENPNITTDPTKLVPYAQPINPQPTTTTTEEVTTLPTTEPTTFPTLETTTTTTKSSTLPTTTQPTHQNPIIDPNKRQQQHAPGEGFVNTRRLRLHIRTGPGLEYTSITLVPKGTHVTVLDTSNPDWYKVQLRNGTVGYAYSYYIKFYDE